jgi:hypothetical protein
MKERAMSRVNIVATLTMVHLVWQVTAKRLLAKTTMAGAGSLPDPVLEAPGVLGRNIRTYSA